MRAILMFNNCERQSHKTAVSTDTTFEVKGEPKQIRTEAREAVAGTEVPLLTSLRPYR